MPDTDLSRRAAAYLERECDVERVDMYSARGRLVFMAQAAHARYTFDDYLRVEKDSGIKHEFVDGQILAMSGGTPEHAGVTSNVSRLLGNVLEGRPCRVYSPGLRVRVAATGIGTCPDVTVICGKVEPTRSSAPR